MTFSNIDYQPASTLNWGIFLSPERLIKKFVLFYSFKKNLSFCKNPPKSIVEKEKMVFKISSQENQFQIIFFKAPNRL
jgi:hypothetical protein